LSDSHNFFSLAIQSSTWRTADSRMRLSLESSNPHLDSHKFDFLFLHFEPDRSFGSRVSWKMKRASSDSLKNSNRLM